MSNEDKEQQKQLSKSLVLGIVMAIVGGVMAIAGGGVLIAILTGGLLITAATISLASFGLAFGLSGLLHGVEIIFDNIKSKPEELVAGRASQDRGNEYHRQPQGSIDSSIGVQRGQRNYLEEERRAAAPITRNDSAQRHQANSGPRVTD